MSKSKMYQQKSFQKSFTASDTGENNCPKISILSTTGGICVVNKKQSEQEVTEPLQPAGTLSGPILEREFRKSNEHPEHLKQKLGDDQFIHQFTSKLLTE
ncbi:hypothetical protein ILYODFUR_016663 [Ilyodon furcidens]|uniref:Uncharacterized protein n=1 Tax=Ilyodon furcidens TaxID=33524 RepID=A0ABV0T8I9_9TELE